MARILIEKSESIASVVEKIIAEPDSEIVLIIPQNSELKKSAKNFELLKREAKAVEKKISIESVDKEILELAQVSRLKASHPLFQPQKPSALFDIIPASKPSGKKEQKPHLETAHKKEESALEPRPKIMKVHRMADEEIRGLEEIEKELQIQPEAGVAKTEREKPRFRRLFRSKIGLGILALIVVAAAAFFLIPKFWSRAEVAINFKKIPWQYQDDFSASKTFAGIDAGKNYLPLEVFRQQKNTTRLSPASGKIQVSEKAAGRITIYNAYSSQPQILVATTRFQTPDGKIFRLDNQVVVPGAAIKNSQIIPSSIEANVTADQPGPDYNLGPIDRLTIPGFKNSPRYQGFYGALPKPTSGGFIGVKAVPTDQDISQAKAKTSETLKTVLQNSFLANQPAGFVFLPGASEINITKLTVNKNTDNAGNFSVFGEAEFIGLGFKEADLKAILQAKAAKEYPQMIFQNLKLDYQNLKADFGKGQLNFTLASQGTLTPDFSAADLKIKIANLQINEARAVILGLPQLTSARISIWPFWLNRLPAESGRLKIITN